MTVTMLLLVLLGAMFLRGFREVIAIAVVIVGIYLAAQSDRARQRPQLLGLSSGQVRGLVHATSRPAIGTRTEGGTGWLAVAVACLLFFPKLALGLSGFETGVAVMPLVKGDAGDDPHRPMGRIRNTRKLLATAALIMSCMLLGSSVVTTMLISPEALVTEGRGCQPCAGVHRPR